MDKTTLTGAVLAELDVVTVVLTSFLPPPVLLPTGGD